jgi:hypothetical protein
VKRSSTKCAVQDQFCRGEASTHCRRCEEPVCLNCAIEINAETWLCHACLRMTGFEARAESHLRALGGTPEKAEPAPWTVFKH